MRSSPDRARLAQGARRASFAVWPMPDLRIAPAAPLAQTPAALAAAPAPSAVDAAYETGFEDGRKAAVDAATAELRHATTALRVMVETLQGERSTFAQTRRDNVAALALAAARRLMLRELALDPTAVAEIVAQAIEAADPDGAATVRLNPQDLRELRERGALPMGDDLTWVADESVTRGGCQVETPHRLVDGRVEPALAELYHRMIDG